MEWTARVRFPRRTLIYFSSPSHPGGVHIYSYHMRAGTSYAMGGGGATHFDVVRRLRMRGYYLFRATFCLHNLLVRPCFICRPIINLMAVYMLWKVGLLL